MTCMPCPLASLLTLSLGRCRFVVLTFRNEPNGRRTVHVFAPYASAAWKTNPGEFSRRTKHFSTPPSNPLMPSFGCQMSSCRCRRIYAATGAASNHCTLCRTSPRPCRCSPEWGSSRGILNYHSFYAHVGNVMFPHCCQVQAEERNAKKNRLDGTPRIVLCCRCIRWLIK